MSSTSKSDASAMPPPITLFRRALLEDSTISPLPVTIIEIPTAKKTAHATKPKISICLKINAKTRPAKTTAPPMIPNMRFFLLASCSSTVPSSFTP